jgi:hypothetical protein
MPVSVVGIGRVRMCVRQRLMVVGMIVGLARPI